MFFILSKTLNSLAMPIVIISVLLLISAFTKRAKWKKVTFSMGLFLLLLGTNDFITNEIIGWWEIPVTRIASIPRKYKLGVVLTGVTRYNAGPEDRVYFGRGADRVVHTLQLYKSGIISKILISGGSGRLIGNKIKEADELAQVFHMMGVPLEDMLIENTSRNTYESAVEVEKMIHGQYASSDCLLISSAFHLRRARACFEKAGIPMNTFSVDFLSHIRKFYPDILLVPKADCLLIWQTLTKEWVGMMAYKIAGYI